MSFIELIETGSPYLLLAGVVIALLTGKLVLPREVDAEKRRYAELLTATEKALKEEKDRTAEFKKIAFQLSNLGAAAIKTAEEKFQ
jgi:hypothetical protein